MYDFKGKTAFITGAGKSEGIGRAIALRLARDGADIAVSDLKPVENDSWRGIESVVDEVRALGRRAIAVYGDISRKSDVDAMVDSTVTKFGQIDMLVANAAAATGPDRVPVINLPEAALDLTLSVNVRGTFLCCQAVGRHLVERDQGGRMVIMSSGLGKRGMALQAAYSSSKFAVVGLTQCLAHELGPHGITVNAICPGTITTDRVRELAEATHETAQSIDDRLDEMLNWGRSQTALKRVGRPEDVANLAAFLCSSEADYLTGLSVSVSGGTVMH